MSDSNMIDAGGGGAALLKRSLSEDEYNSISDNIRNKIEQALNSSVEDYLTAKALFETQHAASESKLSELKALLDKAVLERDELKSKVDCLTAQFDESSNRLNETTQQLSKIRDSLTKCEKEMSVIRKERDEAVDERQIAVSLVTRKESEIERLSSDNKVLNDELKAAVVAKCEALSSVDDVTDKQTQLQLMEKRMENEMVVVRQQNVDLRCDLARIAEQMTQQRRESSAEIQQLHTKLALKEDELAADREQKAQLVQSNQELTERIDKLTETLREQNESEIKLIEHYQKEVRGHQKMVDLHKNMLEVAEGKINELSTAVRDLQRLLGEATTQYGELETKLAQTEEDHKQELERKHQTIQALRQELEAANQLLHQVKQESSEEAISRLSPLAASTAKLMKSGLTLSQLYCQYAQVSEELINQKYENEKLQQYVEQIHKEIEEKAPILLKQRQDYDCAINMVNNLTVKVDELVEEQSSLRKQAQDSECNVQFLTRENKRYKHSVSDLSRQVCYLLKELEGLRGNFVPVHERTNADIRTTSDVIEKHLVTFKDIEELQLNNEKLMAALRELSEEKDQQEIARESIQVTQLKNEIKELESRMESLEEREQVVLKQVEIVKQQRDVYHKLFNVHAKPGSLTLGSEEMSVLEEAGVSLDEIPQRLVSPQKTKQQEPLDEGSKIALEELKKTFDSYRAERCTNERMLNETIERLMREKSDLGLERAKLCSQAEYSSEKCKTLATTVKSLRAQVSALEEKCSSYAQTTARLEESHRQLRQEAMSAMTKLSVAETTAANLKQENLFLKDSEKRLMNERNIDRKTRLSQEMLMANLETLKAKFECSDAEGRKRLEDRLDEAHKQLTHLTRKLQEEQEKFSGKIELLEQQVKTARERYEEEKKLKDKALEELEEARRAVTRAEERLEAASHSLGTAISQSQPVIDRDNKIKDLEKIILNYESDVKKLEEKLSSSKTNCEEMREMCQITEQQLKEITEQHEQLKRQSDQVISEMKKTENELRNNITQLEIRLSTSHAAEAEIAAQREGELASLRQQVSGLMEQINSQREHADRLEGELKEASQAVRAETEKYMNQLEQNKHLQKELDRMVEEVKIAKLNEERMAKESEALQKSHELEVTALNTRLSELDTRALESEQKTQEVAALNELLHQQIERLTEQIDSIPPQEDEGIGEMAVGGGSTESGESKTLMEILQHVRKEKSSAVSLSNSLKQEKLRLECEVEVLKVQIEELKKALDVERSSSDTPTITAQKHSHLLHQVEAVSQLTESNKVLTEERDRLVERLSELEATARRVEEEIVSPVKLRASELSTRLETLELENNMLKQDSQRWRTRAEELLEKSSKVNPEDLKRLSGEKDNLTRQLNQERELSSQQRIQLQHQIEELEKAKSFAQGESSSLTSQLNQTRQQLETLKQQIKETTEKNIGAEQRCTTLTAQMEDIKAKEMQIRQIAKKYKTQFMELTKAVEDERRLREAKEAREASVAPLAQPGPSNQDDTEQIKQLTIQLTAIKSELETTRKECETLQNNSLEKEDRAKNLLKNARNRIGQLMEEKQTLAKELSDIRSKGPKGDAESRISALESRISRLEKEKSDEQSEKERLGSEVEILTSKLRQLERYQGSKPSTSCVEKGTNEPPTANIKPMSGPSTSTTKQHQNSATVTPWRETTPFASIRPLSQPTRNTVVVQPSQTTSPNNQLVMVAPQQSVHTSSHVQEVPSPSSSHMDYMPVTVSSSATNSTTPLQRATLDETQTPPQAQANVALVLPQPLTQARTASVAQTSVAANTVQEQQSQGDVVENTVSGSVQEPSEQSVTSVQPPVLPIYIRQVEDGQGVASSQEVGVGSEPIGQPSVPSSSSSSVSTSHPQGLKRPHPPSSPSQTPCDHDQPKIPPVVKRRCVSGGEEEIHDVEVEYEVPTSSQRDQEDDPLVISDDDVPDQGTIEDGQEFEEEETYPHMQPYQQELAGFDEGEGPDIDEGSNTDQDNNEVDIIDDSNEVPNQCESSGAVSVGAGSTEATSSVHNETYRRQQQPSYCNTLFSYDEAGDDSIVPSTPTLYVPRRVDGFGEPVSSPHVPSPRFTFGAEPAQVQPSQPRQALGSGVALAQVEGMDDTRMDLSQLDEGRRVPTTPSLVEPQDGSSGSSSSSSGEIGQSLHTEDDMTQQLQPPQPADISLSSSDGVTSEGVKEMEEEGREAEAGPSCMPRSLRGNVAKRSARVTARRQPPQPIVWEKPNVSTSSQTPTTQTVTMIPFRGGVRGRGGMGRGGAEPQPGTSTRPPAPFVRGNRARRSARGQHFFNQQQRF